MFKLLFFVVLAITSSAVLAFEARACVGRAILIRGGGAAGKTPVAATKGKGKAEVAKGKGGKKEEEKKGKKKSVFDGEWHNNKLSTLRGGGAAGKAPVTPAKGKDTKAKKGEEKGKAKKAGDKKADTKKKSVLGDCLSGPCNGKLMEIRGGGAKGKAPAVPVKGKDAKAKKGEEKGKAKKAGDKKADTKKKSTVGDCLSGPCNGKVMNMRGGGKAGTSPAAAKGKVKEVVKAKKAEVKKVVDSKKDTKCGGKVKAGDCKKAGCGLMDKLSGVFSKKE